MQNLRRRSERDVENAHKYAIEKFVKDFLEVMDSMDKGDYIDYRLYKLFKLYRNFMD